MFGSRAIARTLACAALLSPLAAAAAFFQSGEGRTFIPKADVSYRSDDASFDKIAAETQGWTSQRDKPFTAGPGKARIWAKFDLPHATPPRRALLGVGP